MKVRNLLSISDDEYMLECLADRRKAREAYESAPTEANRSMYEFQRARVLGFDRTMKEKEPQSDV